MLKSQNASESAAGDGIAIPCIDQVKLVPDSNRTEAHLVLHGAKDSVRDAYAGGLESMRALKNSQKVRRPQSTMQLLVNEK